MIYITGDTHGPVDFAKLKIFADQHPDLTKDDYVIIAGDCGIVWSEITLANFIKNYESLTFTILFIDGNHENFDLLNSFDTEEWNGGKVHKISDSIYHLMRGQVFTIEGKTFFTFGGAESIDKHLRIEGLSWWAEEVPNREEYFEAIKNLKKFDYKVDYIITHTIDEKTLTRKPFNKFYYQSLETSKRLDFFEEKIDYAHWYFAHFHQDMKINPRKTCLYNEITQVPTRCQNKAQE